jgi:hypothetical protein
MNWSPTSGQIVRLEKKLTLPKGARPLGDYGRYYWGTTENGTKIIRGALVWGQQIGVHMSAPPLGPTDQGCDRIYLWYELGKEKILARCDGVG